ncbi:N,N-dimethylformamidase beta subunit family domain-containing protein [Nocardia sp. NPDC004123]
MTEQQRFPRHAWTVPGWQCEIPGGDPSSPEIWCYTDQFSYTAGDTVAVHVHTTADRYRLEVVRDGAHPKTVYRLEDLPGKSHPTPPDSYTVGCGWPVAARIPVDPQWRSGLYLVIARIEVEGRIYEREHFFVLRAAVTGRTRYALMLTTATMTAYNDWGGANHYRGLGDDPEIDVPAPVVSTQRPIARGMLRKPVGAPRSRHEYTPPPFWQPHHEAYEWAFANGYSRHHADAFWATYERPFVVWAENHGYDFDYLTQHDLHFRPESLRDYQCLVIVGHDEYWTAEMRDAVDDFVDNGGNVARFAGNFLWQVRLDDTGATQTCYKLPAFDPLYETDPSRVTTVWDAPIVGRPGAQTMGLTGFGGVYSRYGNAVPRSSGGFTVYRPEHWLFEGTDLYYGDVIGGAPVCTAAFELDGVDYTFRKGLPYPTFEDGAPETLEILALAPAVVGAEDRWNAEVPLGAPEFEAEMMLPFIYGDDVPEYQRDRRYGAGMVGVFTRGAGTVVNAGSCEWVNGLIERDFFTEQITHNALRRLGAASQAEKGNS